MKRDERKQRMPDQESQLSLTEALSALEGMLSNPQKGSASPDHSNQAPPSETPSEQDELQRDQATIPVLSEMVLSNKPFPASTSIKENSEPRMTSPTSEEDFSKAVDRLVNELRAIVQAGIEESNQIAMERIMTRVNDHIETVLPQVLQEILRTNSRSRRNE